jgi:solute carrier family 12 (sodium/potassium/chloride transporter), member 2
LERSQESAKILQYLSQGIFLSEQTESSASAAATPALFGTFKGVYLPCMVTIIGVVVYLRLGWVVANTGLTGALTILALGIGIAFLTVLSISAIATNMRVGGGGAYFIISRALGLEAGAAIGLPLYIAQVLGIAFFLAGFAETIQHFFPFPSWSLSLTALVLLFVVVNISTSLAMRMQAFILGLLTISFISFFLGVSNFQAGDYPVQSLMSEASFWQVFAVFFPACTGIIGGIALSGELKDPKVSIPRGTIGSILTAFILLGAIIIALYAYVPRAVLLSDTLIMQKAAAIPLLVTLGIWGATISSAMNNLVGAPRTVKALAEDRILPQWVGRESGKTREPRVASFTTFILAGASIFIGDVNTLASLLTMFFLTAFGAVNLIAGLEGLVGNPSWRPSFRTPWQLSIVGALLSLMAMLMINPGAAFTAIIACVVIYLYMRKRGVNAHWNDMRKSLLSFFARASIYRMEEFEEDPKTWRPHIMVFSGSPSSRMYLVELAESISHGKGFMTICTVLSTEQTEKKLKSFQRSIQEFLAKKQIAALVKVVHSEDYFNAANQLVRYYGLGTAVPNTFIFGETTHEENFIPFAKMIKNIHLSHKNILIVREDHREVVPLRPRGKNKRIDVWWGRIGDNASFSLTVAYMLQNSQEWMGAQLVLKSLVTSEEEKAGVYQALLQFIADSRTDIEVELYVIKEGGDVMSNIRRFSEDADLVFIGMRPPGEEETDEGYARYYQQLLADTHHFPELVIGLRGEEINFKEIFS